MAEAAARKYECLGSGGGCQGEQGVKVTVPRGLPAVVEHCVEVSDVPVH
jgi:hypothetical protein